MAKSKVSYDSSAEMPVVNPKKPGLFGKKPNATPKGKVKPQILPVAGTDSLPKKKKPGFAPIDQVDDGMKGKLGKKKK